MEDNKNTGLPINVSVSVNTKSLMYIGVVFVVAIALGVLFAYIMAPKNNKN